jgi:uncharacterized membrane protein YvlD (DUF360 family)
MDTLVSFAPVLMILFISLTMISYGLRMVILTTICVLMTAFQDCFSFLIKFLKTNILDEKWVYLLLIPHM